MLSRTLTLIGGVLPAISQHGQTVALERRGVLLTLTDASGHVGCGEASPLPGYSLDTLDEALAALETWHPPAATIAHVAAIADAIAILRTPAARCAAETALLDLCAQRAHLPLHRLLNPTSTPHPIPLSALLPDNDPVAAAVACAARGLHAVKLKIGRTIDRDLQTLAEIRQRAPSLVVRVDANGSLPPSDTVAICRELAQLNVAWIEEPTAAAALLQLPRLALGVALDESLQQSAAEAWIDAVHATQPLAAVILKPTALGGILRCRSLGLYAARHGAAAMPTHSFDGPVGMAAAAELALALPTTAGAGLTPHDMLAVFPRWQIAAIHGLRLQSHTQPGLGLTQSSAP